MILDYFEFEEKEEMKSSMIASRLKFSQILIVRELFGRSIHVLLIKIGAGICFT